MNSLTSMSRVLCAVRPMLMQGGAAYLGCMYTTAAAQLSNQAAQSQPPPPPPEPNCFSKFPVDMEVEPELQNRVRIAVMETGRINHGIAFRLRAIEKYHRRWKEPGRKYSYHTILDSLRMTERHNQWLQEEIERICDKYPVATSARKASAGEETS
ncbi:hypothetical protein F4779DRAFT_583587 [Xylariaceae sp. FL0662B]|nr:hypothetical protein F4779DRAFT_583587 [Xylariaceae sp. FL0662B]